MSSFQVSIPEKVSKQTPSRKRKVIENKLSNCSELVKKELPTTPLTCENEVIFVVQSETDSDKSYNVKIVNNQYGVKFECNCGDQWNITPPRNNCKHIGGTLSNMMKEFVLSHVQKSSSSKQSKLKKGTNAKFVEETDDEINIDSIIDQFKELMSH